MSLKYRRIVVDESALAPIAGRKLTFDKVCIVMRCKTFECIRGSSRFKISLAYRNRDTPGRFLFSNLSLFLSRSPSGATSAAFFRGPGLTWHTATTTGVTQRPAISFIEERRIRDESRAHETLSRRGFGEPKRFPGWGKRLVFSSIFPLFLSVGSLGWEKYIPVHEEENFNRYSMKVDLYPENKYGSRFEDVKSKFSTFSFQNLSILLIESFSFWILALISEAETNSKSRRTRSLFVKQLRF